MTYSWIRVTTSGIISKSPTCVGAIFAVASATSNNTVTVYDGESSSDPQIITLIATNAETRVVMFQPFLRTNRGLYLSLGSSVTEVLVQYGREDN